MNLRQQQQHLAIARVYMDGLGYAASTEAGRDIVAWEGVRGSGGLKQTFARARMVAAVLHAMGGFSVADYGRHHWMSREHARSLGEKIGQHRGLFMYCKLKPPSSPSDAWGWLVRLLEALGLEVDYHGPLAGTHLRIYPASYASMLNQTEPDYRRFSPRGAYAPNYSEVSFLSCGVRAQPDLTRAFYVDSSIGLMGRPRNEE